MKNVEGLVFFSHVHDVKGRKVAERTYLSVGALDEKIPDSPPLFMLQAMKSWVGSENKGMEAQ